MKCCCINKDICILCQEIKYYNIYCTRCVSSKVCYNCSSGMLESSFINCCPVCKLESTEDKKWYKIKYNKQVLVPVNTEQILFVHEKESKLEKCCLEADELCRKILILYKYSVLIIGCILFNHAVGMFLIICFSDDDNINDKDAVYLITVPSVVGILFLSSLCLCIKVCFTNVIDVKCY